MTDPRQTPKNPVPRPPTYPVPEDRPEDENDLGLIHIHNSVIAVIARMAAVKVPGVVDLVGSIVDGIAGIVGRKPNDRGVHVEIVENGIVLELNLVVEYGVNIPKVAWQVQTEVRQAVERMTGKAVKGVNVVVQNILVPKEEKPAPDGEPGE
jgi:uncharacterized alkaline shock family protein YloU